MKNLKRLFNTIILAGAVILFGVAGYSDNSTAQLGTIIGNASLAVAMILFGLWGKYTLKQAEKYISKIKKRSKANMTAAVKMMEA